MVRPTMWVDPIIRGRNTPLVLNRLFMMPTFVTSGFLTMRSGWAVVSCVLLALLATNLATLPISVRLSCPLIGYLC